MKRCLFCRSPFPVNGTFHRLPYGGRIAFDPERGRLWLVCGSCFRWSLLPVEDRDAALWELERAVHDRGRPVAHTAHVVLFRVGPVHLIRIGGARLVESAWWRYGTELRKRKAAFDSRASRVAAATFGALQWVGETIGLADPDAPIDWSDQPLADVVRWRRFGWAAWRGREDCPFCGSTLTALRYDLSWWTYPLVGEDGRMELGVPCPRCDPWTPANIHRLRGDDAENALRRVLAYQNVGGAGERTIRAAAEAIESTGSAGAFAAAAASERACLWKLGATRTVALEIALSESVERRWIDLEVKALEHIWRREEELARIVDEELTPAGVIAVHLRRLPIRAGGRRPPRILERVAEAGEDLP